MRINSTNPARRKAPTINAANRRAVREAVAETLAADSEGSAPLTANRGVLAAHDCGCGGACGCDDHDDEPLAAHAAQPLTPKGVL